MRSTFDLSQLGFEIRRWSVLLAMSGHEILVERGNYSRDPFRVRSSGPSAIFRPFPSRWWLAGFSFCLDQSVGLLTVEDQVGVGKWDLVYATKKRVGCVMDMTSIHNGNSADILAAADYLRDVFQREFKEGAGK